MSHRSLRFCLLFSIIFPPLLFRLDNSYWYFERLSSFCHPHSAIEPISELLISVIVFFSEISIEFIFVSSFLFLLKFSTYVFQESFYLCITSVSRVLSWGIFIIATLKCLSDIQYVCYLGVGIHCLFPWRHVLVPCMLSNFWLYPGHFQYYESLGLV